jgi:CubicO group peptidase (beta-lactamase class C family)
MASTSLVAPSSRGLERPHYPATARTKTPAISAAVGSHGEFVFFGAVGWSDLEPRPGNGADYDIGSVSKVITEVAVLQLVEQGKLQLDDDVRLYAPAFPDHGQRILLRYLLTHRLEFDTIATLIFRAPPTTRTCRRR